jgi:DNA repair protein SbcC/Rad50
MRPQSLTIRGLRSYTTEQHIDFSNVGLMAILGDTGAGKSSILEALCFVLYGGCTWDKRNAKVLIADGVVTMQVRLVFTHQGKTWQVTRTASRGSSPPSRHELVCLDDGSRFDSMRQVNSTLQRMIGLEHDAFLKAVVLPQGRFQDLLHTTAEGRTAILKGLLGLDHLDTVRREATACHERMRPQLELLERRRARLLDDPEAFAADATERLTAAAQRRDRLADIRVTVTRASKERDNAREQAANARDLVGQLEDQRYPEASAELRLLAERAHEVRAEQQRIAADVVKLEQDEQRITEAMAAVENDDLGQKILAKAVATLESALTRLAELDAEAGRLATREQTLVATADELDTMGAALVGLVQQAEAAENRRAASAAEVNRLRERLAACRTKLTAARSSTETRRQTEHAATTARAAVTTAQDAVVASAASLEAAQQHLVRSEETLEVTLRAGSAAHAASTCAPGDCCPICGLHLPNDFVPPAAPEADRVRAEVKAARDALAEAQGQHSDREAALKQGILEAARAERHDDKSRRDLDAALAGVRELTGPVDLSQEDDDILAPLVGEVEVAEGVRDTANAAARDTRDAATAAKTRLEHAQRDHAGRLKALSDDRDRVTTGYASLAETIDVLPTRYHVGVPLTADAITGKVREVKRWSEAITALLEQRTTIEGQLKDARRQREELAQRRLTEVERPATDIEQRLRPLDTSIRAAGKAFDIGGWHPICPQHSDWINDLAATATWSAELDNLVDRGAKHLRSAAHEADTRATRAEQEVSAAFRDADAADTEQLETLWVNAASDAKVANTDLDRARREAPEVADLVNRIKRATPTVDALRELAALLANGQFPALVVARRQRAFLGLATDQLLSMTGRRFAFSDDFRIIDRTTGQPRDVRSLSGGETFQASLALALAIVELAGRAGGRIDALFLDEGFGSLDADTLADALEAMSRQTLGGRLVAVISHMRAVAENIENVLLVTRGSAGSQAAWATQIERARLVDDDLREGLLP